MIKNAKKYKKSKQDWSQNSKYVLKLYYNQNKEGAKKMNIKPLFDRIVVKQQEAETMTSSGIILADAEKERPQIATVVAVGEGGVVDGHEIVMQVKVGDKILYPKYAGNQFKLDGEEYIILRQSDVLAKLKD